MKREIRFNISKIPQVLLDSVGVYKITNSINQHFYIGSTDRSFRERFREHCGYYTQNQNGIHKRRDNPILWNAFDKYGIENFIVEILEVLNNCSTEFILTREEYYIKTLKPQYNVCQFPTMCGKPNLGRKLSLEWKVKIGKNSRHKHSTESLQKLSKNNKNNAVKLTIVKDDTVLHFNSWVELCKFFNIKSHSALHVAYNKNKPYKGWQIIKRSLQRKRIKVYFEDCEIVFRSFYECDKYLNMWKGYTSTLTTRKTDTLLLGKYKYEIL